MARWRPRRRSCAGLRWFAGHQEKDGHWSLDNFSHARRLQRPVRRPRRRLRCCRALRWRCLPFLGAGQSHKLGIYQDTVDRGLKWLVKQQKPDGDLRGSGGIGRMYAHGLATIVLCEAVAMTNDESLRGPAISAAEFIVRAQHSEGGWRYEPRQEGDLSVVGWQLMALQSAKMAYIDVPQRCVQSRGAFFERGSRGPSWRPVRLSARLRADAGHDRRRPAVPRILGLAERSSRACARASIGC